MPTIPSIDVPAQDAADVLRFLESRYKRDAMRWFENYESFTGVQKARACIMAALRVGVRNMRREDAERAISVTDVELT